MKTFDDYLKEVGEVGHIQSVVQSIVYVSGLPSARPKEMVIAAGGQRGIVQALMLGSVEVLMLDTHNLINGLAVTRTNETFKIPVSPGLLGRVVDPFSQPIDGAGPVIGEKELRIIEPRAPGISERVRVREPLETGVSLVDLLVPLGYGQRELVIGDKKTGKTVLLLQAIASQASRGVICVYVSIGKRQSDIKGVENYLRKANVMTNTCIVAANSADPATMVYLAPFSAMAIAEFFRDSGHNVLIVFDDLTNHAKFYREISLLSKRTPGRSSYPGDIFHLHAALLERAGNIKTATGQIVSITALPVAETLEGDFTGYIQTNLMAITDGHIFFDIDEFRKGKRPAINHALSVSRVGNQTKTAIERSLAQMVRDALTKYQKDLEIARFGVELPEHTRAEISLGEKIEGVFNQDAEVLISRPLSLILLGLLFSGYWKDKEASQVKVDLIRLIQKHQAGDLKMFEEEAKKVTTVDELLAVCQKSATKVTEALYA
jgi:F-type H+-transporting ATPase subunit alpha